MIFDKQNLFSDAQAVTSTAVSTNVIDFGPVDTPQHAVGAIHRDLGKGNKAKLRVQVVTTFNTLTSIAPVLQGSVDEAFSSPVAVKTLATVALADLVAGYVWNEDDLPRGSIYRYMRLNYVVAGTPATLGNITAGLVFDNEEIAP